MIAWFGGTAYTLGTTTFTTMGSAQSVFTAGQRVGSTQYQNHIFFGNGGVSPYKYNGTDFTRHGVPIASGAITVISGTTAVGTLTGDYQWRVAFVNSAAVVGDAGTAPATIALASGQGYLTSLPVAPQSHGVSERKIYRTTSSGTTFFLVGTISDNTTTTYNDNVSDSALGAELDTDQGEPPNYDVVAYHQNRLFCNDASNRNYLWYSDLEEPYTFGATNFQKIGDKAGDIIRGLVVYQNNLIVLCDESIWAVYMPTTTVSDWRFIRLTSAFGSKSPFGAFLFQDKLMFSAMQNTMFTGFAAIAGTTIDPEATELEVGSMGSMLKSEPIEDQIFEVQRAYLADIYAMVFKNKAYLSVAYGDNQTTNNRLFIYDFSMGRLQKNQSGTWVPFDGITVNQMAVYGGKLYGGSSTANGLVYQLDTSSYVDVSTAIDSYLWTKEFSGLPGHENLSKDFRKVRILVDKPGDYKMNVGIRVDSESTSGGLNYEVDLNPGGSLWGTMLWGTDNWGGGRSQDEIEIALGGVSGKRIQFKFSNQNTASQRFKVHGLNYTYNIRGIN